MDETEKQKLIIKKIDNINQKADVINAYMTQLEMEISTEREQAQQLKNEVDEGIAAYKSVCAPCTSRGTSAIPRCC